MSAPAPTPDLFEEIARVRRTGERAALATVVGTRGSTPGKETMRLLVYPDGRFIGTVGGGCVEADVVDAALDVLESGRPTRVTFRLTESATGASGLMCGGELEVFVEPLSVPPLVLFGAGHISKELCTIAASAGFRVTVVDDRASFASAERFPHASHVIAADSFEAAFQRLEIPPTAYCVVVTRGHAMDLECLAHALSTKAGYVGLIGSKVKIRNILSRLAREGAFAEGDLARLHAPIGLDLGGGSHGEIAVSIVAELIAHRHQQTSPRGEPGPLAQKRLSLEEMQRIQVRAASAEAPEPSPTQEQEA